jgi:BlaI family transcriptional regulator, penicillinase repressor
MNINSSAYVTIGNTTMSNEHFIHDPAELGELERELLEMVWTSGEVTADQLRAQIGRPIKDSTIRTVLRRLEEKGYLTHTVNRRTFIYSPSQSRQTIAARAVKRIADWFCEGSMEDLLVGMIDSDVLDKDELQKLSAHIAQMRKAGH